MHFPFFFLGAKALVPPQSGLFLRPSSPPSSGTKTPFHRTRIPSGFGRGKISVYKKIYFRICENIFSYMRKFISLRKKIFRRAEGEKFSCPRKEISMRMKINFRAHGNFAPCPRKRISFRKGENFLGQGKALLGGEGDEGRRRACTLAGHREGVVRRYSLGASPMSFMYLRTS